MVVGQHLVDRGAVMVSLEGAALSDVRSGCCHLSTFLVSLFTLECEKSEDETEAILSRLGQESAIVVDT
jgi:hypothetical protein